MRSHVEIKEEGDDVTDRFVTLGHVSGLHGVQGWLKIYSDTRPRENILTYKLLYLKQHDSWIEWRVEQGRRQGKLVVVKLDGCSDRESARLLMGSEIAVKRSQLSPSMAAGEYYWTDLEGLTVINQQGVILGKVDYLFETGSNDVLVVKGDKEHMIPYLWQQVVLGVDLPKGQMSVDWDAEF